MNPEMLWMVLPPLGWLFWCLGGSGVKPFGKRWRRLIWPLVATGCVMTGGLVWWRGGLLCVGMMLTTSMGYGEGSTWMTRGIIGLSYGFVLGAIKFVWWVPFLTLAWFTLHMIISRHVNAWTWKLVEGCQGALHGALAVYLLS